MWWPMIQWLRLWQTLWGQLAQMGETLRPQSIFLASREDQECWIRDCIHCNGPDDLSYDD